MHKKIRKKLFSKYQKINNLIRKKFHKRISIPKFQDSSYYNKNKKALGKVNNNKNNLRISNFINNRIMYLNLVRDNKNY